MPTFGLPFSGGLGRKSTWFSCFLLLNLGAFSSSLLAFSQQVFGACLPVQRALGGAGVQRPGGDPLLIRGGASSCPQAEGGRASPAQPSRRPVPPTRLPVRPSHTLPPTFPCRTQSTKGYLVSTHRVPSMTCIISGTFHMLGHPNNSHDLMLFNYLWNYSL